jgi:hypothetical protein
MKKVSMPRLREAIEASWGVDTAYLQAEEKGNPALGNCYPSSRVVQHFFPQTEIVEGQVWTGKATEKHFWNMLIIDDVEYHIDLTWQQFPHGSVVKEYKVRDRHTLGDGEVTIKRVELLLSRVNRFLEAPSKSYL